MKKAIILGIFALFTMASFAQYPAQSFPNTQQIIVNDNIVYQIFRAWSAWTFIKLDTRNGRIWQVECFINGVDTSLETPINLDTLVAKEEEENGRFTIYPTQNWETLVLFDQIDGRQWQVQWSTNPKKKTKISEIK